MFEAEARIATNDASRYLVAIAEAWIHTYPVRYDALTAEVRLPGGDLVMTADGDSLSLRLQGWDRDMFAEAKESAARHVDRVAEHDTGVRCIWHEIG